MEININIQLQEEEVFRLITDKLDKIENFIKEAAPAIEELNKFRKENIPGAERINSEKVMEILRISRRTLQRYRSEKKIPYHRYGGKIVYYKKDIDDFINRHKF